jgi:PAS domain-containing protein
MARTHTLAAQPTPPPATRTQRSYADFLLELANDPRRAAELLSDADQMEDESSHTKAAEVDPILGAVVPDFDLTGESVAIVTVSAQPATAGLITDANAAAARMFGYTKREVLGKDANVIIPEPIASVGRIVARGSGGVGVWRHGGQCHGVHTWERRCTASTWMTSWRTARRSSVRGRGRAANAIAVSALHAPFPPPPPTHHPRLPSQ